jgi:hypothetical protein
MVPFRLSFRGILQDQRVPSLVGLLEGLLLAVTSFRILSRVGDLSRKIRTGILVIGGGVSGLSVGWELSRTGFSDYLILELHKQVGGNAVGGKIQGLPHPWGAHYLPIPNKESVLVRELLLDLGVIEGKRSAGRRRYPSPI